MKCPSCKKPGILPDSAHNVRLCSRCVVESAPERVGFDRLDARRREDYDKIQRLQKQVEALKELTKQFFGNTGVCDNAPTPDDYICSDRHCYYCRLYQEVGVIFDWPSTL